MFLLISFKNKNIDNVSDETILLGFKNDVNLVTGTWAKYIKFIIFLIFYLTIPVTGINFKKITRVFPGGPVAKTLYFQGRGSRFRGLDLTRCNKDQRSLALQPNKYININIKKENNQKSIEYVVYVQNRAFYRQNNQKHPNCTSTGTCLNKS